MFRAPEAVINSDQLLKIIHITDTHGVDINCAKLYAAIEKEIAADKEENGNTRHLLVISGDVFGSNTLLSTSTEGQFDVEVITAIANMFPAGMRLFTPGNHDFNYGCERLYELIDQAGLFFLASNVNFKPDFKLKPNKRFQVKNGDQMLSFRGLMTSETENSDNAKKVLTEIVSTPDFNPDPDFIVSHLGLTDDRKLPYKSHVFGGHSHDRASEKRPNHDNKYLVNAFANAELYSSWTIQNGTVTDVKLVETKKFDPAPEVMSIIEKYQANIERELGLEDGTLSEIIFTIANDSIVPGGLDYFGKPEDRVGSIRVSDALITRATADAVADHCGGIALIHSALFRSNFDAGQEISQQNLFETYFMNNYLWKIKVTGAQLVRGLTKGVLSNYRHFHGRGQLLHPSANLHYTYDIKAEPGETIRQVTIDGKPINLDESYEIVATNYIIETAGLFSEYETIEKYQEQKIPLIVAEFLMRQKDKVLSEQFSQRITSSVSVHEQVKMAQENARDKNVDIASVDIKLEHHKQPDSKSSLESTERLRVVK